MTTHAPYKPGAHVRPLLPRPGRNRQARPAAAGCHAIAREQPRRPGNRLSPRSARPPRPAPASRARERHPRPSPGTAGPHRGGRWGPAAWPGEQVSHPRRAGMPGWAVRGSCGPAGHAPPSPHSRQEGPRPDPAAARRAPPGGAGAPERRGGDPAAWKSLVFTGGPGTGKSRAANCSAPARHWPPDSPRSSTFRLHRRRARRHLRRLGRRSRIHAHSSSRRQGRHRTRTSRKPSSNR